MSYEHFVLKVDSFDSQNKTRNPIELTYPNTNINNIVKVIVKNASIPNIFYNITSANNKITFYGNEGAPSVFIWSVGHYTITTLLQAFNTWYGSTVLSLNEFTNKVMFSLPIDATFDHNNSTIFYNLGLDEDIDFYVQAISVVGSTSAPFICDLSGVKNIYIESKALSAMNTIETTGYYAYIGNIGVTDYPYGSVINYINQEMDLESVNRSTGYNLNLSKIDITLRDSHHNVLDMSNIDWHINFKIIYKAD